MSRDRSLQYQDDFYHVDPNGGNGSEAPPTEQYLQQEDVTTMDAGSNMAASLGTGPPVKDDLQSIEVLASPSQSMKGPSMSGLSSMDSSVELPVRDMVASQTEDGNEEDNGTEDTKEEEDKDEAVVVEREDVQEVGTDPGIDDPNNDADDETDKKTGDDDDDDDDQKADNPDQKAVEDIGPEDEQKIEDQDQDQENDNDDQKARGKKWSCSKTALLLLMISITVVALAIVAPKVVDIDVEKQAVFIRDQIKVMFMAVPETITDSIKKVKPLGESPETTEKKQAEQEAERRQQEQERIEAQKQKQLEDEKNKRWTMMVVGGLIVLVIVAVVGIVVCVTCVSTDDSTRIVRDRMKVNAKRQAQGEGRQRREMVRKK